MDRVAGCRGGVVSIAGPESPAKGRNTLMSRKSGRSRSASATRFYRFTGM